MECRAKKEVLECFVDCHWRLSVLCVVAMWDWPTPWWMLSDLLVSELAWVSTCSLNNFSRLLLFTSCCRPCLFVLIRCYEQTTWYTRECETTKMREWEETEVMQWCCQADCKNYLNLSTRITNWRLWLAALKVDHWVATRSREQGVKKAKTYITGANGPWLQFMREQCRGLTISL